MYRCILQILHHRESKYPKGTFYKDGTRDPLVKKGTVIQCRVIRGIKIKPFISLIECV